MSKSIEEKPPRLHGASTLEDAAAWLTYWSQEVWDAASVLGRLCEWTPTWHGYAALSPESLKVVVPAGTVLIDKMTGEQKTMQRHGTLLVGGAALDGFLKDLHEHGEAIPTGLVSEHGNARWAVETVLTRETVRLSPSQVESLLPAFDGLVRAVARGEHQQLLRAATSAALTRLPDDGSDFELPTGSNVVEMSDQRRRLSLLRELGGTAKYKDGAWKFTGIGELVRAESSRKRHDEKTIRADLRDAAQEERDELKDGAFRRGLLQR
jgi:hypothetical protein